MTQICKEGAARASHTRPSLRMQEAHRDLTVSLRVGRGVGDWETLGQLPRQPLSLQWV